MLHLFRVFFTAALFLAGAAAGTAATGGVDRTRLARGMYAFDFENRRDRETGLPLPDSADLDADGWPDFWEPVLAVGYPGYLVDAIAIVPDSDPRLSGAYRDVDNHVLRMRFDGSRVGIRTRFPALIDPGHAYEFSVRSRDRDLDGAAIRSGVEWLRVEDGATESIRRDEIQNFFPGQTDWAVSPRRMTINDPPARANAVRLFIVIEAQPAAVSVARHGEIWFDDIQLRRLPGIRMRPRAENADLFGVDVEYTGLSDNIPDPDNPGYYRGRRYFRRVVVTDIFNRPVQPAGGAKRDLAVEEERSVETLTFPTNALGVYYVNLRVYDADDRLAADVTRSVAVGGKGRILSALERRSGKPAFGVRTGAPPLAVLRTRGLLGDVLSRVGARQVKIVPWPDDYDQAKGGAQFLDLLAEEVRRLRSSGIGVTGVIAPPERMFGGEDLAGSLAAGEDRLARLIDAAGKRLGLFIDSWQWGDDDDASLERLRIPEGIAGLRAIVDEFSRGLPMAWNIGLGKGNAAAPEGFGVVNAYFPAGSPVSRLWPTAARAFPWLFAPYHLERGAIYPPAELSGLAPVPPADSYETTSREREKRAVWLSLEPGAAPATEPDAAAERAQLEELMIKTVRAAVAAPEVIFLGDIFDPSHGFLRQEIMTAPIHVETAARPAFLAAATLAAMLEGAEYLGRLGLLEPYEAHVFRRAGTDESVIALWHNDFEGERSLDRSEIASGPPLRQVDWAGNSSPLASPIRVRRVPMFVTGLPASVALTRLSVRIAPEPPVRATTRRQPQALEVVNHTSAQLPLLFRLRYAARADDGGMENGWSVAPEELRANLLPLSSPPAATRIRYEVSPDPNSPLQTATPYAANKDGEKIVQVRMGINSSPPADMTLYLPFGLRSDIDVDIVELKRSDDPGFATLQLKVRWFPPSGARGRGEIKLAPFYLRKGEMREAAPIPVTVPAQAPEERGNPNLRFESVELRIPRHPPRQTWVGLTEDGGGNYYLADVTGFVAAPGTE